MLWLRTGGLIYGGREMGTDSVWLTWDGFKEANRVAGEAEAKRKDYYL